MAVREENCNHLGPDWHSPPTVKDIALSDIRFFCFLTGIPPRSKPFGIRAFLGLKPESDDGDELKVKAFQQREKRQTSPLMPPINFDIADQKRVNVTVSKCDMTEMEGKLQPLLYESEFLANL